jgi:tRNA threonylcarbamoyl adenosine modification protein (Sua5/YciO/YrdC/YwlC family)
VLIGARDTMRALTTRLSPQARELAEAFWPGGLTLICRQQPSLQWDLGDSRATVALRMPDQTDAIDLLLDNGPLAVSSANTTGQPPATTVEQAQGMLGEAIDIYLDAGATPGETPSTIVDCTGDVPRILRLGVIGLTDLQSVVPEVETPETTD